MGLCCSSVFLLGLSLCSTHCVGFGPADPPDTPALQTERVGSLRDPEFARLQVRLLTTGTSPRIHSSGCGHMLRRTVVGSQVPRIPLQEFSGRLPPVVVSLFAWIRLRLMCSQPAASLLLSVAEACRPRCSPPVGRPPGDGCASVHLRFTGNRTTGVRFRRRNTTDQVAFAHSNHRLVQPIKRLRNG